MTQPVVPAPAPSPTVTVYDPNGALVQISATDLPNAQSQGYVVAEKPAEDKGAYELAREKGFGEIASRAIQVASPLLSYEQGTVAGATAGLGEGVQRKIAGLVGPTLARAAGGPDMTSKEAEEFYRQIAQGGVHGGLHATGEVAGMVGSAVAGGALRGAAGAAGSVGRGLGLLSEAGEGAAAGARALTGGLAARGALGRAAATGIEYGVRGGIELGAYEGVKELSEEMFGDAPLSAQKIFAAAADGAEGGALFGGALGAGGSLVKSGAKGIASGAMQAASRNADSLLDLANEQRWRALDPLKKFSQQAEARVKGGTKAVGETLGEYGIVGNGLSDAMKADRGEIAKRIDNAVDVVGQKLGAMTEASTAKVKYSAIQDAIDDVVKPLKKQAGFEGIVNSLEGYNRSLAGKLIPDAEATYADLGVDAARAAVRNTDITIQDAIFQRQALDQLVYKEAKALDPNLRVGFLRDFRSKFENVIVDAFDDAAKAAGNPSAKAELLKLKGDYQKLKLAQEATEATTARMATNRNLSMSDMLSGGFASSIGTAALGPVGGVVGGVAGAAINRFGRERGNAIVASIADKLAKFGGKGRAVTSLDRGGAMLGAEKAAVAERGSMALPPGERPPLALPAGESAGVRAARAEVESLQAQREALVSEMGEAPKPRLMAPKPEEPALPAKPAEFDEALPELRDVGPEPTGVSKKPTRKLPPEPKPIDPEPPVFSKPPPEPPAPPKPSPASVVKDTRDFETRLSDAIHESPRFKNTGFAHMSELRKEFPELSPSQFDEAIIRVRNHSQDFKISDTDSIKNLSDEMRAGIVVQKYRRYPADTELSSRHLGDISTFREPSGLKPQGAAAAPDLGKASAEFDSKMKAWEAERAASEQARADWQVAKLASEAEHAQWRAEKASFDAEMAGWKASKAETESVRKEWLKAKADAQAEHRAAVDEWESKWNAAIDEEEAYNATVDTAKTEHQRAVEQWQAANAEAHAEMLQKAAEFQRAKDAIAKVDEQIEKAAKGLVEPELPASDSEPKPLRERYEAARANADQIGQNLDAVMRRAAVPEGSMPNISKALGESVVRSATFLANAGPPPVNQLPTLGAPLPRATTASAMQDFLDRYEAVNNPMSVLRKFQAGRVSTAQVQALKVVSPELFAELQKQCMKVVVDKQAAGQPVPFQARQRMHVLLGILTDPSQDPKLTKLLQSNLNIEEPPPQTQAPSRPVQMTNTPRTYDRLEEG